MLLIGSVRASVTFYTCVFPHSSLGYEKAVRTRRLRVSMFVVENFGTNLWSIFEISNPFSSKNPEITVTFAGSGSVADDSLFDR